MAYTSGPRWPEPPRSVYIRSLDGKMVRRLTNAGDTRLDQGPSFSADDKRLVFVGAFAPRYNQHDIFVIGVDGTGLQQVTHESFNSHMRPRFYAEDSSILFESYKHPADALKGQYPPIVISQLDLKTGKWAERIRLGHNASYSIAVVPENAGIAFAADSPREYQQQVFYTPNLASTPKAVSPNLLGHGPIGLSLGPAPGQTAPAFIYFVQNDYELWRVSISTGRAEKIADRDLFDDPLHWKP